MSNNIFMILTQIAKTVKPIQGARIAGALILPNGKMYLGINQSKSHPLQARFRAHETKIFLHAEIDCLRRALRQNDTADLKGSRLYLVRVIYPRNWQSAIVTPCKGCQMALDYFGVKKVVSLPPGIPLTE